MGNWLKSRAMVLDVIAAGGGSRQVAAAYRDMGWSPATGRTMLTKALSLGFVSHPARNEWYITEKGKTELLRIKTRPDPRAKTKKCLECGTMFGLKPMLTKTGTNKGWYSTVKFCSFDCYSTYKAKNATGFTRSDGYHIRRGKRHHRTVMEEILGRKLEPHETIHHKNGNRDDNRPENLELWAGQHGSGQRTVDKPDIWSGNIPRYLIDCYI